MYAYAAGSPGTFGQEPKAEGPRDLFPGIVGGGMIAPPKPVELLDLPEHWLDPSPQPPPFPWAKLAFVIGGALALSVIGGTAYRRRRKRRR